MSHKKVKQVLLAMLIFSIPFLEVGLIILITNVLGRLITWSIVIVSSLVGFAWIVFVWKRVKKELVLCLSSNYGLTSTVLTQG